MKKAMTPLLLLALAPCFGAAMAEKAGILGRAFPDCTATDTRGSAFALSEAPQERGAVLINIWATRGPLREAEKPLLNEAYRQEHDIAFPWGATRTLREATQSDSRNKYQMAECAGSGRILYRLPYFRAIFTPLLKAMRLGNSTRDAWITSGDWPAGKGVAGSR